MKQNKYVCLCFATYSKMMAIYIKYKNIPSFICFLLRINNDIPFLVVVCRLLWKIVVLSSFVEHIPLIYVNFMLRIKKFLCIYFSADNNLQHSASFSISTSQTVGPSSYLFDTTNNILLIKVHLCVYYLDEIYHNLT